MSGDNPTRRRTGARIRLCAGIGVDVKFLVITDDADRAELEEAMTHLRQRQARAVIDSTRAEIGADLDELLELWTARG